MRSPYRYVRAATKNGESLLSLCCGIGLELWGVKSAHVIAVDTVAQYLAEVHTRCPQAKTVCSDALTYVKGQPDNSVDVISLLDGIEHMGKDVGTELIGEMKRVCRKKMLLFTPEGYVRNEPHDAWGIAGADGYQIHKSGWTIDELQALGFTLISRQLGITQHCEPYHALMLAYEKTTGFSIIVPLDPDRLALFTHTKRAYDAMQEKKEFIIPTRHELEVRRYLDEHLLSRDVRIIPYAVEVGFNCSKALNIGVRHASYPSLIITSPEVLPVTPVLSQLTAVIGMNVVCQVWDEDEYGNVVKSLVNTGYKSETPGMYFLAMFNKADIEKINGWDEEFMKGYAYEDDDFGARWVRAGIPFTVRDDICGRHQYHPRIVTVHGGTVRNRWRYNRNTTKGIIKCRNGLAKL